MSAGESPNASAAEPAPRSLWPLIVLGTTVAGVLSGARIYLTYNAHGFAISALDGVASGLMSWWLWIPLVPLILRLSRRFDPTRSRPVAVVALHLVLGGLVSFVQLSLFSALSGVVRAVRYGDSFRIDLVSPVSAMLSPGLLVYGGIVALGWWQRSHRAPAPASDPAPTEEPALCFQAGKQRLFLRAAEIDWVSAAGNYLELHAGPQVHLVRETLKSVHERLGTERFLRVHRSTLVRRGAVQRLASGGEDACVVLRDGTELAVGRTYRADVAEFAP